MTTETQKATDVGAVPRTEVKSEGAADFDALLREYEGKNSDPKPGPDMSGVLRKLEPVVRFAETEMATRQAERLSKDIGDAIKFVKDVDEAKDVPDKLVRGLLEVQAGEDPSFRQAFEKRHEDPATWQAKLGEARKSVVETLKGYPTNRVESDIAAARASVSGAKPQPDGEKPKHDPVKLMKMSEQDYQAYVQEQIAAANR